MDVRISEKSGGGWELLVNGAPYYVKGAGGTGELEKAKKLGANSIRTWSTKEIDSVLAKAQALGLTVCVGLWLKHASSNPDFFKSGKFEAERKKTIDEFVGIVKAYAGHPSVLMWMIGNEANAEGFNDFAPLYQFINAAAVAIKAADPRHPVGTVTTSPTEAIASCLNEHCPAIEVWGVNVYGSMLERLPAKMREIGFTRAYCVTEYGPQNWWQVKATDWGARLEPHSSAKALTYRAATETMAADGSGPGGQCVGGYAFKWGWKTQVTVTWVNLLNGFPPASARAGAEGLEGGETTEAVDEISRTGEYPSNRAPRIDAAITLNGSGGADSIVVAPGASCRATVGASDPDGDPLRFAWMVLPEVGKLNEAAREGFVWDTADPTPLKECAATLEGDGSTAVFQAPTSPGYYRVYVYVSDGNGHIATDNAPFAVSAKAPVEVRVSADTYVRDGEHAMTVFGAEAEMATKWAEPAKVGKGFIRSALLRFDLPADLPAWSKCELRVFAIDGDKASRTVNCHGVEQGDAAWDEAQVCANACPLVGKAPLASAAVASPFGWVKWDVTGHVRAAGAGGPVSLALLGAEKTEKTHTWAAKEGGAGRAARLVFTPQ